MASDCPLFLYTVKKQEQKDVSAKKGKSRIQSLKIQRQGGMLTEHGQGPGCVTAGTSRQPRAAGTPETARGDWPARVNERMRTVLDKKLERKQGLQASH